MADRADKPDAKAQSQDTENTAQTETPKRSSSYHTTFQALRKLTGIISLTPQEQALVICILLSLVAGAIIKHYREVYRETHPTTAPSPTPSLRAKDLYVVPTNPRARQHDPESDEDR